MFINPLMHIAALTPAISSRINSLKPQWLTSHFHSINYIKEIRLTDSPKGTESIYSIKPKEDGLSSYGSKHKDGRIRKILFYLR